MPQSHAVVFTCDIAIHVQTAYPHPVNSSSLLVSCLRAQTVASINLWCSRRFVVIWRPRLRPCFFLNMFFHIESVQSYPDHYSRCCPCSSPEAPGIQGRRPHYSTMHDAFGRVILKQSQTHLPSIGGAGTRSQSSNRKLKHDFKVTTAATHHLLSTLRSNDWCDCPARLD